MKLEYYEDFQEGDPIADDLRNSGVSFDDWDYMIITYDVGMFVAVEEQDDCFPEKSVCPNSWYLDRLLAGCCSNYWYSVTIGGVPAVCGVAYHA